jgi:CMP-N-acetylneuraminic acid synthetase
LAVINARGGSKRLPNKNRFDLAGKPLIVWTIEAAKASKYIDKLIVSTDNPAITQMAEDYGAEVPFIRPAELANDKADSISVLKHAAAFFEGKYECIMLLQPTSPLRTTADIDAAIEKLNQDTKSVVSVCKANHSPLWMNTLPEDYSMKNFIDPAIKNERSQDLPVYYRLNGAVYVSEIEYLFKINGFIGKSTKALIMPENRSIDIDTELDFIQAEIFINKNEMFNI